MKDKNVTIIKRLTVLLIIQILIIVFVNVFSFSNVKTREFSKPLFKSLNKQAITSFELRDSIDGFKAMKEDKEWYILYDDAKLPADKEKIEEYIKLLSTLPSGVVIYNGNDDLMDETYGLNQKTVQNLSINTKNKSFIVEIGSVGSRRGTTYIRKDGENRVRQIDSALKTSSPQLYKEWTDKRIVKNKVSSDVSSIRFDLNLDFMKIDYTVTNREEGLSLIPAVENRELDQNVVATLIKNIATLTSDNFKISGSVDGKEKLGTIFVDFKDNTNQVLEFYAADSDDIGNFIIKTESSPYLFLFHTETLENMLKTRDALHKT